MGETPRGWELVSLCLAQSLGAGVHEDSGGHVSAGCLVPASVGCRPTWGWRQVGI